MYKKSKLYAPRVVGDLDLGLEPSRIGGDGARRWSRIDSPGGRLPGRPDQSIYAESAIQNFRVGTRRIDGDRVLHYCFADEALLGLRGKFTDGDRVYANTVSGVVTPALLGATQVTFGPDAAVGLNELAEGYLGCFNPYLTIRIKSNTASLGAGDPCTVTLEEGLPYAILAGAWLCAYPNIYRHVINTGEEPPGVALPQQNIYNSVCAVPIRTNTGPNTWFWGLTWGPVEMVVNIWGNLVGRTANQRNIWFGHDGGIVYHAGVGATDCLMQRAGRLCMNGNTVATPNGDQLVFVELAP